MRFGLVWGQLAVLKISNWAVKYATLENIAVSARIINFE